MNERREITLHMRPPTALARIWYQRLGSTPPLLECAGPEQLARLVPYQHRGFHHAFATTHGYFWIPCPLCDRPFGGHESGDTIPDPTRPPNGGIAICSQCTTERNRRQP